MSLVKIKVFYDYYQTKRVTPFFISEEILCFSYQEFKEQLIKEVPHLRKLISSLRLTVNEGDEEVDLSPAFFTLQMKGLLENNRIITIKVMAFDSLGPTSSPISTSRLDKDQPGVLQLKGPTRARKSLNLQEKDEPFLLPLDRYVKKQNNAVKDIADQLKRKRQEFEKFENRLKNAEKQNAGVLTTCGHCHLRLGHTKRSCTFSPCRSVFSCGQLSKHSQEKTEFANLQRRLKT